MTGPLAGRSVVVARAPSQVSALADRLAGLGAEVVVLPVTEIGDPDDDGRALAEAAGRACAGAYRWVVVTSANAVARLLAALDGRPVPPETRWAAVGTATAAALAAGGVAVDLVPPEAVAEVLVEAFPPAGNETGVGDGPAAVLFPRAAEVRPVVTEGLVAKGWTVDEVVAYVSRPVVPPADAVAAARRADAVVLTSASVARRVVEALGVDGLPPVAVSIGPVTSAALRAAGREPAAEADPHTVDGVVAAVVASLT